MFQSSIHFYNPRSKQTKWMSLSFQGVYEQSALVIFTLHMLQDGAGYSWGFFMHSLVTGIPEVILYQKCSACVLDPSQPNHISIEIRVSS